MATISTAIRVQDAMTPAFCSMNTALNIVLNSFEAVQDASSKAIDTASIQTARQELANANVIMQQVEDNAKKAGEESNKMPQGFEKANNSANKLLKTLMGFSVIQKGINLISNQFGSAIERLDTMNNYPKVMSNLGIGEKQANASIKILSENLKGLPTTLNDAVSSVQNFTSVNGNVNKSTQMFLALNNAILAGGGTTQVQQSALEQLSQAYAKGKPDMMEWRSAMTAMPAQMKQVAKAMGYINTNKLGEDLRTGKVSMNKFMDTFIQLNEQGVNGFQSFEQQARNATGGFATSIANMKSAVTRGITNVITSINNGLQKAGLPTIQDIITNIGSGIETMLTNIGSFVENVITYLQPIIDMIKNICNFVRDNWSVIEPILIGIIGAMIAWKVVTIAQTIAQWALNLALSVNPIMLLCIAIGIIIGLLALWISKVGGLKVAWLITVDTVLLAIDAWKFGIMRAVYGIINFIELLKLAWQSGCTNIVNFVGDLKANVLMILQNMCNGAIDIINKFIGALNKILPISIKSIEHVTFGTQAQIENEANKQARNAELQSKAEEIARNRQERENELNRMAIDAVDAHNKRQTEIRQAQVGDTMLKRCTNGIKKCS